MPTHLSNVGFADVAVDLRDGRSPLPRRIRGRGRRKTVQAPDGQWVVSAHANIREPGRRSVTFCAVVLTAPDGWRGAVLFSQFDTLFNYQVARVRVPFLTELLEPATLSSERSAVLPLMIAQALPVLRETMSDPEAWDDRRSVSARQRRLLWASMGATVEHGRILDAAIVHPMDNGVAATSLLGWVAFDRDRFVDIATVAEWVGQGVLHPAEVPVFESLGLTASVLAEWSAIPGRDVVLEQPPVLRRLIDVGWTPEALRALGQAVIDEPWHREKEAFFSALAGWTSVMPPSVAAQYLAAGMSRSEASADYTSSVPAGEDVLRVLTGLRGLPDPTETLRWNVDRAWVGEPALFMASSERWCRSIMSL